MDDMTYHYKPLTNQLDKVVDAAPDAAASEYDKYRDIKQGQTTGNYSYDAIGNLTADVSEGLTAISWSVYGKILSIAKNGSTIAYSYDASGNRISKTAGGTTTVYVRDASGNVMSIYEKGAGTALKQTELHLYGSSRTGTVKEQTVEPVTINLAASYDAATLNTYTRNEKRFELSNHLGNVLVTVSDKKLGLDGNNDKTVDYYTADVLSAQDYYPFGMQMPNREFSSGSKYRYGMQGQEMDDELKGEGNSVNFDFRVHDPRLGKFLSVDPLTSQYSWNSPYAFSENRVIQFMELEGLEITLPRFGPWYVPEPIITLPKMPTAPTIPAPPIIIPMPQSPLMPQSPSLPKSPISIPAGTEIDLSSPDVISTPDYDIEMFYKQRYEDRGTYDDPTYQGGFKNPKANKSKSKDDVPDWAKGHKPRIGEAGKDFAKRLLDKKYGEGEWKEKQPGSEFNKIKKWGDTDFKNVIPLYINDYHDFRKKAEEYNEKLQDYRQDRKEYLKDNPNALA